MRKENLPFDFQRKKLVESIIEKGIRDRHVLNAILRVPRHEFVSPEYKSMAYIDKALPIDENQTVSQPYTVAFMTELLQVKPGMKVLEIGTGSGYQTAVLLEMGAKVHTIERIKTLYEKTKKKLKELNYFPEVIIHGNGYEGISQYAPYDRIIVTAAAPYIPQALIEQLKEGGILVIPVGKEVQTMMRITKQEDGRLKEEKFGKFLFVPMLQGKRD